MRALLLIKSFFGAVMRFGKRKKLPFENFLREAATKTNTRHPASFWKWEYLELGSGLLHGGGWRSATGSLCLFKWNLSSCKKKLGITVFLWQIMNLLPKTIMQCVFRFSRNWLKFALLFSFKYYQVANSTTLDEFKFLSNGRLVYYCTLLLPLSRFKRRF